MTLSCNCDMPVEVYADWCQDQGWDVDELRSEEEAVLTWSLYFWGQPRWTMYGHGSSFEYYKHDSAGAGNIYGDCGGVLSGYGPSLMGNGQ